jgi:RNA polymerase sigma-70 factor (ECF subfamily)
MSQSQADVGRVDPRLDAVLNERRHLINIAYRMLGSLAEAEDAVQETYSRWYALPGEKRDGVQNVGAWLTTVVSRICLDSLGSARMRRERYVGDWVPEPVPTAGEWIARPAAGTGVVDPADRVTLDESVSMAFLVVLESMTPAERVAFILHDVFRYSFPEIADIVGRTPAACRQLASSARRRIAAEQVSSAPAAQPAAVVNAFKHAWQTGDLAALIGLLADDATVVGDGGGRVRALPEPLVGADVIAAFYANRPPDPLTLLERTVNGQPGLVIQQAGNTVVVVAFDVVDDKIQHIWAVANPDKLRNWTGG